MASSGAAVRALFTFDLCAVLTVHSAPLLKQEVLQKLYRH